MSAPRFFTNQRMRSPDGTATIIDVIPSVDGPWDYIYLVQPVLLTYLEEELTAAPPRKTARKKTA